MFVEWATNFFLAFIPLFVAIDPLGLTSLFIGMIHNTPLERRNKIITQATITATLVAVGFMFLGQFIFKALGITVSDFKIAGGLILLVLAIRDLLVDEEQKTPISDDFGIVPLGLPLIAGPATLTTLLVLIRSVGVIYTLIALLTNLLLLNLFFRQSAWIQKKIGNMGLKGASKIIELLLVAIAVNMIRRGLQGM